MIVIDNFHSHSFGLGMLIPKNVDFAASNHPVMLSMPQLKALVEKDQIWCYPTKFMVTFMCPSDELTWVSTEELSLIFFLIETSNFTTVQTIKGSRDCFWFQSKNDQFQNMEKSRITLELKLKSTQHLVT